MLLISGRILYVTDSRRNILCYSYQEEYCMLLIAGGILYVTDISWNIVSDISRNITCY